MYTISTQLAKAIFNIGDFFYKDSPTESVQIENGIITYTVGKSSFEKPVDSFFFMCKDWALRQGYMLSSGLETCSYRKVQYFCLQTNYVILGYSNRKSSPLVPNPNPRLETVISHSEQQAVFDACQWILNIKGV